MGFTTAVLVGSALDAPFEPADAVALGWLIAIGLPLEAVRSSKMFGGRLLSSETWLNLWQNDPIVRQDA